MDAFGNTIGQVDEFEKPIGQPDNSTGTSYSTVTETETDVVGEHGTGTGVHGTNKQQQLHRERRFHHSGSSSSSSSEDDGMGGRRRKKGLTEKIKEKQPSENKLEEGHVAGLGGTTDTAATTTTTTTTTDEQKERLVEEPLIGLGEQRHGWIC